MKFYLNNERYVNPITDEVSCIKELDENFKVIRYKINGSFEFYGEDYEFIKGLTGASADFVFNKGGFDSRFDELICKLELKGDYNRKSVKLQAVHYDLYTDVEKKQGIVNSSVSSFLYENMYVRIEDMDGVAYFFRVISLEKVLLSLFSLMLNERFGRIINITNFDLSNNFDTIYMAQMSDIDFEEISRTLGTASSFTLSFEQLMTYLSNRLMIYYRITNPRSTNGNINIEILHISVITKPLLTDTTPVKVWDKSYKVNPTKVYSEIERNNNDGEAPSAFKGINIIYPKIPTANVKIENYTGFYCNVANLIANREKYPTDRESFFLFNCNSQSLASGTELINSMTYTFDGFANQSFKFPKYYLCNTPVYLHSELQTLSSVAYELSFDILIQTGASTVPNFTWQMYLSNDGTTAAEIWQIDNASSVNMYPLADSYYTNIFDLAKFCSGKLGENLHVNIKFGMRNQGSFALYFFLNFAGNPSNPYSILFSDFATISNISMKQLNTAYLRTEYGIKNYRLSQENVDNINKNYLDHSDTEGVINGTTYTDLKVGKFNDVEIETISKHFPFQTLEYDSEYQSNELKADIISAEQKLKKNNFKTKLKLRK